MAEATLVEYHAAASVEDSVATPVADSAAAVAEEDSMVAAAVVVMAAVTAKL